MAGTCNDHLVHLPDHCMADQSSVTENCNRLPREVTDAPRLSVPKKKETFGLVLPKKKKLLTFGFVLHNGINFLVSPKVVRQPD